MGGFGAKEPSQSELTSYKYITSVWGHIAGTKVAGRGGTGGVRHYHGSKSVRQDKVMRARICAAVL